MAIKQMTFKGSTVDFAIQNGLQEIALPQENTFIRIIQKDSQGIFGHKEAIISIAFDEDESSTAILEKQKKEFLSKFQFRFFEEEAQVQVPSTFYDDIYLKSKEERINYLKNYLSEKGVANPEEEQLQLLATNFECKYRFVTVKTLETFPLNERGATIHFNKSEDLMLCTAVIFYGEGCNEEEVFNLLKEHNIIKGILKKNIQRVLANKYVGLFNIARGAPPQHDLLPDSEKFFHENEQKEFSNMLELLTIDTRSVKDINIAERNQLLMRIKDVIPGCDGYQIDGEVLPKETIEDESGGITFGDGVYLSDNKKEVYAKRSGHIKWKEGDSYLDIEPIYIVDGNVDFGEGNIIGFVGKVLIKGSVKPKFSIIAEGDIEIQGSVEDATIKSTTGSVMIGETIVHKNEGYVSAKETVHCIIASNAKIFGNRVNIEKEAMNCTIEANEITAIGTPGVIIGGNVSARNFIQANTIGSEGGAHTKIYCGDVSELRTKLREQQSKSTNNQSKLKEYQQITKILKAKSANSPLNSQQKQQLSKAEKEIPLLESKINDLKENEEKIREEIEARRSARMEVFKILHPGVDVRMFEALFIPQTVEQYTGFKFKDGMIYRYPL